MLTWNIDPVLVELGPLEIRYYGVFFALSLLLAYGLAHSMFRQKKYPLEHLETLVVYLIVGLILGARFGHIVFYELDYYLANPEYILQIWRGGLASHGATIGVLVAYGLYLWRHPKARPFFKYADLLAIVAAFPIGLVRLGNFFNSEILGRPWDGPWAVVFPQVDEIARHPSQLYEFLIGALMLVILYPLWRRKHRSAKPGFFFGIALILYFSARFGVEFFKDYPLHESALNLTTGQLLSLPFVIAGFILLIRTRK